MFSKRKEIAEELKKEKENYKILSEKYYDFCKKKYIETQKELVSLHVLHVLSVDDYQKYLDDVRAIKLEFYECTDKERDRYIYGEVDDVIEYKYRSAEWSVFDNKIEKICREFHDLIFNA